MRTGAFRLGTASFLFLSAGFAAVMYVRPEVPPIGELLKELDIQSFKTVYISMILEAFPFLLIGVFISSLLQVLISEDTLRRLIPKNPVVGLLAASCIGILFPICECGMIPVVRRLIQKGMPPYLGFTYLLAAPILNPVVFFATYSAFRTKPDIAYARMGLASAVAIAAGILVFAFVRSNPLRITPEQFRSEAKNGAAKITWTGWAEHMLAEFFDMAKYLLFGAFVASCLQTFVSRGVLTDIGKDAWISYPFMMGLSYALSLCSTSDAFVAASFAGTFAKGPLLAFMVFGPMLDFKATLMLFSAFRFRFVVFLIAIITALAWAGSMLASVPLQALP